MKSGAGALGHAEGGEGCELYASPDRGSGHGSERLVSTARTTETTYRFTQLALGRYTLTVRAVNAWGQQGDPASVSFRIARTGSAVAD